MSGLLDIDKRLDSLRHVGKLFPVAHHREHGEHEDEGRGGHERRRVRYESLCAGLLVTSSLPCLGSRARFLEVLAQIGFRHGARSLGRVHNGTNGSSTTDRLPPVFRASQVASQPWDTRGRRSRRVPHFRTSALVAARRAGRRPCPSAPPCFASDRAASPPMPGVGGLNILLVG